MKAKKKSRKLPYTPNSRIRSALRVLWLRSRERAACLKAHGNCCSDCGVKASVAKGREVKLDVHHNNHVGNWQKIFDVIREELLCSPDNLIPLCEACHDRLHKDLTEPEKETK